MKRTLLYFLSVFFVLSGMAAEELRYFEFKIDFSNGHEHYMVAATSEEPIIEKALEQLDLPEEKRNLHINGIIEKGNPGYNRDWSWHFVPNEWVLAEYSVEVCDGIPDMVEDDLDYWINTVGQFCPWGSFVNKELSFSDIDDGFDNEPISLISFPGYIDRKTANVYLKVEKPVRILLKIYDINGIVKSEFSRELAAGMNTLQLKTDHLSNGIYFCSISHKSFVYTEKFVVLL